MAPTPTKLPTITPAMRPVRFLSFFTCCPVVDVVVGTGVGGDVVDDAEEPVEKDKKR